VGELWKNGSSDLDAVWDGKWGLLRDGCISLGWRSIKGKGQLLGVNMGTMLHSCAKVHELIELSFRAVSGMGPGIGLLDGVHVPQWKEGLGFSLQLVKMAFLSVFL